MSKSKVFSSFFFSAFFLLFAYGCSASSQKTLATNVPLTSTNRPTLTKSPTTIPTLTPEFNVVLPINPTIYPTISNDQENSLFDLLHLDNCELPCYLGITPGKTTWGEAKLILKRSGAYLGLPNNNDYFVLYVGDPSIQPVTPDSTWYSEKYNIRYTMEIKVENDIVQLMWVRVSAETLLAKYQNYWSNYSLREIFLRNGSPKEIVGSASSGGGYELVLIYDEQELIIFLNGTFQNDTICPNSEKKSSGIIIAVKDSGYKRDLNPWGVPLTDREIWKPINEFMGVDTLELYNQIMNNPSVCFTAITSN